MTATGMGRTWVYARLQELAADGRVSPDRPRTLDRPPGSPGETVVRADVRDAPRPYAQARATDRRPRGRSDGRRSAAVPTRRRLIVVRLTGPPPELNARGAGCCWLCSSNSPPSESPTSIVRTVLMSPSTISRTRGPPSTGCSASRPRPPTRSSRSESWPSTAAVHQDNQDPETSRGWQLGNARKFVEPCGGAVSAEFFDVGQSRSVPWDRRREGARLLAALKDPRRTWTGVVVGEGTRCWFGNQFSLIRRGSPRTGSSCGCRSWADGSTRATRRTRC